ncbi:hypothetical protein CFBP4215_00918 [Pseudomonas syringae pv. syringae]|nr:hypothetical protein CFBP4215_00918 [Pseudomonas syringae pv. syringae]
MYAFVRQLIASSDRIVECTLTEPDHDAFTWFGEPEAGGHSLELYSKHCPGLIPLAVFFLSLIEHVSEATSKCQRVSFAAEMADFQCDYP